MAQQPDLFTSNSRRSRPPDRPQVSWAGRAEAIIRIVVRLYLGLVLIVIPWLTFWTQNNLFTYNSAIFMLANNGFVRGMVSGLGC